MYYRARRLLHDDWAVYRPSYHSPGYLRAPYRAEAAG